MKRIHDSVEWATALVDLPGVGADRARTAVVPSAAVGHALRRILHEEGRGDVAAATRFVTLDESLEQATGMRPVGAVLLPYALQSRWPDLAPAKARGLARTLETVAEAGLPLEDGELAAARDALAGVVRRGDVLAAALGRPWPYPSPTLVVLDGSETALERTFVESLPDTVVAVSLPRPRRAAVLERFAGIEDELEAAVVWARGCRMRAAILVPRRDPLTWLLADRLTRAGLPSTVLGGRPATAISAGARVVALLRALRDRLTIDSLAGLLPSLRPAAASEALTPGRSTALLQSLGILGGAGPGGGHGGGSRWADRARARLPVWREALAGGDGPRTAAFAQRIADLEAILPALDALVGCQRLVDDGAPLADLWRALSQLMADFLVLPGAADEGGPPVLAAVDTAARQLGAIADGLHGDNALAALEALVAAVRLPATTPGDEPITVASIDEAQHLRFSATRVLGLCDGGYPVLPLEDPLLPAALRERVPGPAAHLAAQRAALARVLANGGEVTLSAPAVDLAGSAREPSALALEVAETTRPGRVVTQVPATLPPPPPPTPGPAPGHVPITLAEPPGLSPTRPVSAHQLGRLLRCPHRYLLEVVLGFAERPEALPAGDMDPMTYGQLVHAAVEAFFRVHGEGFGRRQGSLADWRAAARPIAAATLAEFLQEYALASDDVRAHLADRLARDVAAFLEHDWDEGRPRRFVDVERAFGFDDPIPLPAGDHTLYVRGQIDRIDVEDGRLLVRDLKTGRAHPRIGDEREPTVELDLQIALYGRIARRWAEELGVPPEVALAYVYPAARGPRERAFRGDAAALDARLSEWLEVAAGLLAAGQYPRTPRPEDCRGCPFRPVCGPTAQRDAAAALADAASHGDGPLAAFRRLKEGEP